MKDYGTVESPVKPESMVIDDYSVWVNSGIEEFVKTSENETVTMYQYNQKQYDKNEYVRLMSDKNVSLDAQLTDVEVALTEVYESKEV